MTDKETILADGQSVEVEVKPLTLVCHSGEVDVQIPSRVEINPEGTVARAKALTAEEWVGLRAAPKFLTLWKCVWGDTQPPEKLIGNLAFLHTVGLIVLIVETAHSGRQPFIRLPETYLHPKQQVGLADLLNTFSKGW
jgi:hypothetical protein